MERLNRHERVEWVRVSKGVDEDGTLKSVLRD